MRKPCAARERIELGRRRDATLERAQCLQVIRASHAVDDEAWGVGSEDGRLPKSRDDRDGTLGRLVAGLVSANDLDEFHARCGIEEMQAEHALGMRRDVGKLVDR